MLFWQAQQVSPVQETSPSCPPICSKFCAPDCPVRCCNFSPPSPYVPSPPPEPVFCQPSCFKVCYNTCPKECCSNTQTGVARDTPSYTVALPCPANCHPICHDHCPAQCCQKTHQTSRRLPSVDDYPPSSTALTVRSKMVCSAKCHKFCSKWCPKHCCSKHIDRANIKTQHKDSSIHGNKLVKHDSWNKGGIKHGKIPTSWVIGSISSNINFPSSSMVSVITFYLPFWFFFFQFNGNFDW